MDLIKDMSQSALNTGERAIRLFLDLLAVASERVREVTGQPRPLPMEPPPAPRPVAYERPQAPAVTVTEPRRPKAAPPDRGDTKTKTKAKAKPKKKAGAKGRAEPERPDQMIRVLELLTESGKDWLSAKELSDAGAKAGTPILPGNVRKVIRARGGELIETRPRDGSRRGALEYRITAAGRQALGA